MRYGKARAWQYHQGLHDMFSRKCVELSACESYAIIERPGSHFEWIANSIVVPLRDARSRLFFLWVCCAHCLPQRKVKAGARCS